MRMGGERKGEQVGGRESPTGRVEEDITQM